MLKKVKFIILALILFGIFFGFFWGVEKIRNYRSEKNKVIINVKPEKTITIPEGWNINQIETRFIAQDFPYQGNLDNYKVREYQADYSFLTSASPVANLEGYLFPDTYRLYASSTWDYAIRKMLDNFDQKLSPVMRAELKKNNRSIAEAVILASIVEKEVNSDTDRKIVAGIFWDRLKNGQALESCATLAYILGENKKQYTTADTKTKSAYNTYLHRGLPPGPIDNPGLSSLMAVVYPTYTDYNYFLSRPDTGETVFSVTYAEHVKNKQKYLQ